MDNNQFNQLGSQPRSTKKIFELVGFGCSCLGCLLTIIFSIVTCARGPEIALEDGDFKMSLWIIGVIIAVIIAIAGLVLSILSMEKGQKMSKLNMIAIAVSAVAIIWALIPNATLCGYNCALNNKLN